MLSSLNRLPSGDISLVLHDGIRIHGQRLELVFKKRMVDSRFVPQGDAVPAYARFAFIVSTKVEKRATARNRMKRLVREAVQHLLPTIHNGTDGVLVIRGRLPDCEVEVEKIVRELFQRAHI